MGVKKRKSETAVRLRAAVFLLLAGLVLPLLLPHGERLVVPPGVEDLLSATLAGETDPARIAYVQTACGLVGRVSYFWGGKSEAVGWDDRWGMKCKVTSPGSAETGARLPFGLDCSGFTAWAAGTSAGDPSAGREVGACVRDQWARCVPTETPRPGDLAFFPDLSHVGIVLGRGEGETLYIVHCAYSRGGVVVTGADVGFAQFGTPTIFQSLELSCVPGGKRV